MAIHIFTGLISLIAAAIAYLVWRKSQNRGFVYLSGVLVLYVLLDILSALDVGGFALPPALGKLAVNVLLFAPWVLLLGLVISVVSILRNRGTKKVS